jgi:hypothetical protein
MILNKYSNKIIKTTKQGGIAASFPSEGDSSSTSVTGEEEDGVAQEAAATARAEGDSSSSSWWWCVPSRPVTGRLFATGATLGPMIDGLHNQCLLQYDAWPIAIDLPPAAATTMQHSYFEPHFLASSWAVPPLLGLAYVVLGGVLPRLFHKLIADLVPAAAATKTATAAKRQPPSRSQQGGSNLPQQQQQQQQQQQSGKTKKKNLFVLGFKAVAAVLSTAGIVRMSQVLILQPHLVPLFNTAAFEGSTDAEQYLLLLLTAVVTQWAYLDGTAAALLTACTASIAGPLSELPFIAAGLWHYLPEVADYQPLQWNDGVLAAVLENVGVGNHDKEYYESLSLSTITAPCYFAVTMDAIALGRFYDALHDEEERSRREEAMNEKYRLFYAAVETVEVERGGGTATTTIKAVARDARATPPTAPTTSKAAVPSPKDSVSNDGGGDVTKQDISNTT